MNTVKLVAITRPMIEDQPIITAAEFVAFVARVSNPANQANTATAPKLLKYLADRQEWSPFEMVSMVMEITTTRDISRQILRHRSFSFQEFSQRYAQVVQPPVLRPARMQDSINRQSSLPCEDQQLVEWWDSAQTCTAGAAFHNYQVALAMGIAKEVARVLLPEGLTQSTLYMSGSLRSWIHYCQLRTQPGTQAEHRCIAEACRDVVLQQFPELSGILRPEGGAAQNS